MAYGSPAVVTKFSFTDNSSYEVNGYIFCFQSLAAGAVYNHQQLSHQVLTIIPSIPGGTVVLQGFFFNWSPPKFSKHKIPCKLAQDFS